MKEQERKEKKKEVKDPVVKTGFARGIPIEKVLGATREPGELMFFICLLYTSPSPRDS